MTIFYDYILDELRLKDVPDGSGGFWGAFHDTTTQTIASTTTAYPITLNTTDGSNGVRIGSPTSRVYFDYDGVYSITFSLQYNSSDSSIHASRVWLRKNGTDIADSGSETDVPSKHGAINGGIITTVNFTLQLVAGDYLEVCWQGESTNLSLETLPAGTTPTTPKSPSFIFTAVQGGIITQGSTSNSLASLTDVAFTSLASGQIIMSNASGNWGNVNFPAIPSIPSLGSLAVLNSLSYTSLTNLPSLGSLAVLNNLSFTSLLNQPSLSSLAFQSTIDYTSAQLTNKPSLGSLAVLNSLSYASLTNLPSLGSLAVLNSLSYTSLSNLPSLGSLAILNDLSYTSLLNLPSLGSLAVLNSLSFTSLLNQPSLSSLAFQSTIDYTSSQLTNKPSLGSLAVLNSLTKSDIGLGNVTNDAQLKIASNLSDLNNIATARGNLSLGSLAVSNTINGFLPSTASFNLLYTNGISNNSTISTNLLYANNIFASTISVGNITGNNGAFASTVSTNRLNANQIFASNISTGNLTALNGSFLSTVSTNSIFANNLVASLASITTLTSNQINVSNISVYTINGYLIQGENTGDQSDAWYGDASDSAIYFDGTTPYNSLATLVSSTYTLTRDIYPYSIDIYTGVTVKTNGFRIFCQDTLTISGTGVLQNNGNNATGTTAGTGGAGNFFAAGSNGATGLLAASAGAVGTAPTVPTANTLVGGIGGRGAAARNAITTFTGNNVTTSTITVPTAANGGTRLVSAIGSWTQRFLTSGTATNFQFTPSMGGGAGAKSIIGTTATSGGGGGGGGVLFLASRYINAPTGSIQSKGGNGGNAAGSAGNFGGGGGGGGGVIGVITSGASYTSTWFDVSGGDGGNSIGSLVSATLPVAFSGGFGTATSSGATTIAITPTNLPSTNSIYVVAAHIQGPVNNVPRISSVVGGGNLNWYQVKDVQFGTIAAPTRRLDVWYGFKLSTEAATGQSNIIEDYNFNVTFNSLPSSVRINVDEIQNTNASFGYDPGYDSATNSYDSTATSSVVLPSPPSTFDLIWTGVARTAGTTPVAGTGNTLLNSQNTAPILVTEVSSFQQTNNMSWTTATQAGAVSFQIVQPSSPEPGTKGWKGKLIAFYA